MKRSKLIAHIEGCGCWFEREGSRHSLYVNPQNDHSSAVPRHREVTDHLAEKICRDLGNIQDEVEEIARHSPSKLSLGIPMGY